MEPSQDQFLAAILKGDVAEALRIGQDARTSAGPKGIVGCVEGEHHELGARMAADLLVHDGWNVMYIGGDVPLASLVEIVVRTRPVFVGLSFALAERLPQVRDAIARLRCEAPDARLLLGGRGVAIYAAPAQELGADAIAGSLTGGVEAIRAWKQ